MDNLNHNTEKLLVGGRVAYIYRLLLEKQNFGTIEDWEKDVLSFLIEWHSDTDHITVQTSGSTGQPKNVRILKDWMKYSAQQTCNFFGLNERSTIHLCLPAAFIAGKMMIVRGILSNCTLLISKPASNPFADITTQVDFTAITPHQLFESLSTLSKKTNIKTIIVGGGEITSEMERGIQWLAQDIYATYGMTETSSHIALRKANGVDRKDFYTMIGDTKFNIDSRNCLVIENPQLFKGQLTTNDIVEIIDHRSFKWLGRWDNVINSGGIKLVAEEIERKIAHLHGGLMILVGVADKRLGEAAYLVVERTGNTDADKNVLLEGVKSVLGQYAYIADVLYVDKIPETPNGKPDRVMLKQLVKQMIPDNQ